jgi:6,7-dimethyl-8-ribityllumazine synthase
MVRTLNAPDDDSGGDSDIRGEGRRIAIVAARFTKDLSQMMVDRAVATLESRGVATDDITLAWVPGSFELPLICDEFAGGGEYDGVIALGCVIRGETTHYDYVCQAATDGVLQTGLRHSIPVLFGVLTTENQAQAVARADGSKGDKGADCATAVLQMIALLDAARE